MTSRELGCFIKQWPAGIFPAQFVLFGCWFWRQGFRSWLVAVLKLYVGEMMGALQVFLTPTLYQLGLPA